MRIVIDTNVVISGLFFGGLPKRILSAIIEKKISAFASAEIVDEYQRVILDMLSSKQGHFDEILFNLVIRAMEIITARTHIRVCRDPGDDKFIKCAKDCKTLYIVSGDKDLLVLKQYEDIQIITAREFCERYLQVES